MYDCKIHIVKFAFERSHSSAKLVNPVSKTVAADGSALGSTNIWQRTQVVGQFCEQRRIWSNCMEDTFSHSKADEL